MVDLSEVLFNELGFFRVLQDMKVLVHLILCNCFIRCDVPVFCLVNAMHVRCASVLGAVKTVAHL